ncbi:MAG: toluene tolerance protein [Immundisolibacter sp.]|jgi:hypothetical protein|uniref:hypothetical protein n=1 Tax=Immundisolibacter sp. TaxID=1934948 RepID=UPI001987C9D1|nr:hypothetical protein [Immundisolibacter sp.]MBC7161281.1 toluene tolerance protein [Immundisolibacter sp.]
MHGGDSGIGRKRSGDRPRSLSGARLQRLLDAANVLERDGFGIKVAQLPCGTILKLFRRKRRVSSAAWRPYAQRFVRNAAHLAGAGIPTVQVRAFFQCAPAARHVVAYRPLAGDVLRERLARGEPVDWSRLAVFMAHLHRQGIYFRSLHSGNIVCLPGDAFGLIDIADLYVCRRPLGTLRRGRNLRPMLRDPLLQALRERQAFGGFLDAYRREAGFGSLRSEVFSRLAWRQWRRAGAQSSSSAIGGWSGSGAVSGRR